MLPVVEMFNSIDGEGIRAGKLATFIRLAGCNLHCSYCDTPYAMRISDGKDMHIDDICRRIQETGYRQITLTGGEPLIHKESVGLVRRLTFLGYEVNIETNGSIDIEPLLDIESMIITMDYKTPSSGCENDMLLSNLLKLRECDVLKFVMGRGDLSAVADVLRRNQIKAQVYLSPVFGKIQPVELVEFLMGMDSGGMDTRNIRIQLQLHKYIWNPSKRGV